MSVVFEGVDMPTACCFVDGEHSAFAHMEYCKFYDICKQRDTVKNNYKPDDCPVKPLKQELTTKKDSSELEKNSKKLEKETTKNNLADDKTFYEQIVEYCNEHFLVLVEKDVWEDAKKALTTKNDLGVDCISRIETIDYLCKHCPDDGECFKDCDEIKHLRQMPSVTPQEPITPINICPHCGEYIGEEE